jgi:hypothetical protein
LAEPGVDVGTLERGGDSRTTDRSPRALRPSALVGPGENKPGERWLHRLVGREETGDLAAGQLRSELCARLTKEFAVNHGDRRKDCLH